VCLTLWRILLLRSRLERFREPCSRLVRIGMKYYAYRPDSNSYAGIGVAAEDDSSIIDIHNQDVSLSSTWTGLVVHGFKDNPEAEGDFPSLSNFWRVPVMSRGAWDTLLPLIGYCCEALPITHPSGKPYSIIHIMETVDCLDIGQSEVKRFSDGGIMRILRYFFKSELLQGKHIFKLPRYCGGESIVDDDFRNAVEASGLKGLQFKELPMRPVSKR